MSTPGAPRVASMRAVLQPAYGQPGVLHLAEIDRPPLAADGVLVQVVAAGVNKGDWHLLTGTPYLVRAAYGMARPARPIPGMAVAGRVLALGSAVTGFVVGDRVFAEVNRGGFAELVCVPAKDLAHLPEGVCFEDAATLPVSATTALEGLRGAQIQPGQRVLVNGASGGVGSFAVQIARRMGAEVTGVCSAVNAEWVRGIGADRVIDYGEADFTTGTDRYDVIFDLIGNHSIAASRRVLTPQGRLLAAAGGAENRWLGPMPSILGGVVSNLWSAQRYLPVVNRSTPANLQELADWVVAGTVRPVIDRRYRLDELPFAMRYLGSGRTRGKCVVIL